MAKQRPKKEKGLIPKPDKTPKRLQDPVNYDDKNFSWRIHNGFIDYEHHEFGWHKCDILYFLKVIVQRLQSYEGQVWHEIKHNRHCHPWGTDEIPKDCYARLEERQIDIEELYQIPLGNKPRIIGYKTGNIFYLIWWDPEHKFCPTRTK